MTATMTNDDNDDSDDDDERSTGGSAGEGADGRRGAVTMCHRSTRCAAKAALPRGAHGRPLETKSDRRVRWLAQRVLTNGRVEERCLSRRASSSEREVKTSRQASESEQRLTRERKDAKKRLTANRRILMASGFERRAKYTVRHDTEEEEVIRRCNDVIGWIGYI